MASWRNAVMRQIGPDQVEKESLLTRLAIDAATAYYGDLGMAVESTGVYAVARQAVHAALIEAARVARNHESPFAQEHPDEAFKARLQSVVLQALLDDPRDEGDDTQPERHIAEEVWRFLQSGRTRSDAFVSDTLGATCASQEIEAL